MSKQEYQDKVKEMVTSMVATLGDDVEFPMLLDALTIISCNLIRQARGISPEIAACYVEILTLELNGALKTETCQ